jgi:hypothetical protein
MAGAEAATPAGEDPLGDLLQRLVQTGQRQLQATAGSVSLVDATGDRYAKVAERGTSCRLGRTLGLEQGITGQVVSRRRPVALATYADVRVGHLAGSGSDRGHSTAE